MEAYKEQYIRACKLKQKLSQELSALTGTMPPLYDVVTVVETRVNLIHHSEILVRECGALRLQIDIAEEINKDDSALNSLNDRLNIIEEWA